MQVKRGDRVSLNTIQRLFFFQDGVGGINLVADQNETAVIPENASDKHLEQITTAVRSGQLVMGYEQKDAQELDKDSDIKEMLSGGRNKIDAWMFKVRDDKVMKKSVKVDQLEKVIKFEKEGKNRKSVIEKAEKFLGMIGGVSPVEESEQEKLEIKLTAGNSEEPVET